MTWYHYVDSNTPPNHYLFSPQSNFYFVGAVIGGVVTGAYIVFTWGSFPVTLAQIEEIVGTIPAPL
jgi:hypothetical protein